MLSSAEMQRYSRQIRIDEIGKAGQEKIKKAKILVVGAGGLGCPVLLYLVSMGIEHIGIIDYDIVEESNLNRQILFNYTDKDQPKVFAAKSYIEKINPQINIEAYFVKLTSKNALDIFSKYDIIVEASDSFATKFLSNDACVILGKPLVYGAANRFQGQIAVFNHNKGPTLRCLYPSPPDELETPSCSQTGVLGSTPGIIGTIQATEVIKIVTGAGKPINYGVLSLNFSTNEYSIFELKRNTESSRIKDLKDYDECCDKENVSKFINVQELKKMLEKDTNKPLLIDVRDPKETSKQKIKNTINIPYYRIFKEIDGIPKNNPVVFICNYETQSKKVANYLIKNHNYNNVFYLKDGIVAWDLSAFL